VSNPRTTTGQASDIGVVLSGDTLREAFGGAGACRGHGPDLPQPVLLCEDGRGDAWSPVHRAQLSVEPNHTGAGGAEVSNKPRSKQTRTRRPQPKVGQPTRQAPTQQATGWRRKLELRTGPLLVMLHQMPRWVLPVALAALLFFGLILGDSLAWLGGICLILIALFLGWLLVLSWPMLSAGSRFMRGVVVVMVFGVAIFKFVG